MTATAMRSPAQDLAAEMAVLGASLLSDRAYDDAAGLDLCSTDFYVPGHGYIWDAISHVVSSGARADPIAVTARLRSQGLLEDIGGAGIVTGMQGETPGISNNAHHAQLVIDAANVRGVAAATAAIDDRLGRPIEDVLEFLTWAETTMQGAADRTNATRPESVERVMVAWLESLLANDRTSGIATPWDYLNELTGGLRPGLHVVFARPGVGKSAWGLNLAAHAAENGHATLLCSLEMNQAEIADRLIAHRTGINHSAIRDRGLGQRDLTRVADAAGQIAPWPLHIHDDAEQTVARIASAARRIPGLALLIVDYAQLITPAAARRTDNRQNEIATISQALVRLHRRLNVPVVALAQSRRPVDGMVKKPTLSDIRESGQLENDAHVVIGLHRDPKERDIMEMLLLKQRNGPSQKTIQASWSGATFQIGNLSHQPDRNMP